MKFKLIKQIDINLDVYTYVDPDAEERQEIIQQHNDMITTAIVDAVNKLKDTVTQISIEDIRTGGDITPPPKRSLVERDLAEDARR